MKLFLEGDTILKRNSNGELIPAKTQVFFYTKRDTLTSADVSSGINLIELSGMNLNNFCKKFVIIKNKLSFYAGSRKQILVVYPRFLQPPPDTNSVAYFKHCKTEYLLCVSFFGTSLLQQPHYTFKILFETFIIESGPSLNIFHLLSYDPSVITESTPL